MQRYKEQLELHPVHATVQNAITLAETRKETQSQEENKEKLAFLKVLKILQDTLRKLDHDITPWQILDQIHSTIANQAVPQIQAYSQSGNIQNLINANNDLRQHTLHLVPDLLSLVKHSVREKPLKSAEKIATDFIDQIQTKIHELDAQIEEQRIGLAKLEGQIQAHEKPLEDMEKTYSNKYNDWLQNLTQQNRINVEDLQKELEAKVTEEEGKLQMARKQAEETTNELQEMLGIATTGVINNDHDEIAKSEMKASVRWRWKTMALLFVACAWLFYAYSHPPEFPKEVGEAYKIWVPLIKTFSLTAILLFAASFTTRQASSHLENARHLRGVALNVKALDPYLASLHPDQQKELKKDLTQKLFGQSYIPQHKKNSNIDENKMIDILERLLKLGK